MNRRILILAFVLMAAQAFGQQYAKSIFYADVELRPWACLSNLTATVATNGTLTGPVWYRMTGTNIAGRIPGTSSVGVTGALSRVTLGWKRRDGLMAYIVERSGDGASWTNWARVSMGVTNYTDAGTNTWQSGAFTSLVALIPAPTLIGSGMLSTSQVDGVTIVFSNNVLTVLPGASTEDAVARAGNLATSNSLADLRAVAATGDFVRVETDTAALAGNLATSNELADLRGRALTNAEEFVAAVDFNSFSQTVFYMSMMPAQSNAITDGLEAWAALQFEPLGRVAALSNAVWAQGYGTGTLNAASLSGYATNIAGANAGATAYQKPAGGITSNDIAAATDAAYRGSGGLTNVSLNGVMGSTSGSVAHLTMTDNDTTYSADGIYFSMDGTTFRPQSWWTDLILQDNLILRSQNLGGAYDVVPGGAWWYTSTNEIDLAASSNFVWGAGFANYADSELSAHWKMNDSNATAVIEDATGQYEGSAGYGTSSNNAIAGKINGAIRFDADLSSAVYASNGVHTVFADSTWSLAWWEYRLDSRNNSAAFSSAPSDLSYDPAFHIAYETAGNVGLYAGSSGGWVINGETWAAAVYDEWVHWVLVRDGSTWTAYRNGTNAWTTSVTFTLRSMDVLIIGNTHLLDSLNGYMDDVRLYQVALSESDAALIYAGGTGTESDFVAAVTNLVMSTPNRSLPAGTADVVLATWAIDTTNALNTTNLAIDVSANGGTNWWGATWSASAWYSNVLWVSAQGVVSNSLNPAVVKSRLRVISTNPPQLTVRANTTMGGSAQ